MNKSYNIQNMNICKGIFHISFFKALLLNEGETTQGANGIRGETTRYHNFGYMTNNQCYFEIRGEHHDLHVCTVLSVEQFILRMTLIHVHVGALFSVWGSICEIKQ